MAEELQGLLARINEDGVRKVEAERDRILGGANNEATRIVEAAKEQAARLLADAKRESALAQRAGEENLKQASRDVILALETEMKRVLRRAIRDQVQSALTPEVLVDLIRRVADAHQREGGTKVELLLSAGERARLDAQGDDLLLRAIKQEVTLTPVKGKETGFKIGFDGEPVFYDFTAEAISELLCEYLNPRLVHLMRGEKD